MTTKQIDHTADIGKKVERTDETAQNVSDSDLISRKAVTDALAKFVPYAICDESTESYVNGLTDAYNLILQLPSAQPDNQINLCDSCDYLYPECPSEKDDVIFGNGIGNDNICACNKYKPPAQPDRKLIDDYMWKIKQNISSHTAAEGVIAIKYYLEQIYEQIYGKGEKPEWMT